MRYTTFVPGPRNPIKIIKISYYYKIPLLMKSRELKIIKQIDNNSTRFTLLPSLHTRPI